MNIYKITLFGHRDFCATKNIEDKLISVLCDLIKSKSYLEIYIGRNGEFDIFAASVIRLFRKIIGKENCSMTLVLPYIVKNIEYFENYYDDVIIWEGEEKTHPKEAITKRNMWMVENSNLLICFVAHNSGGAYKAMQYANKLGIKTLNLFQD